MKILVAVKAAAALEDGFRLSPDGRLADPVLRDLNEWDAVALEAAVQLSEAAPNPTEVIALTIGAADCEIALVTCLARGADRAIRVWDDAVESADVLCTAHLLSAVVRRESPDLVFCGAQSSDAANGATGSATAAIVGLPHVAIVRRLEYDFSHAVATVERELEGGLVQRLRVSAPALITVQTGLNEPRYANLRALKRAQEKPIARLSLEDLGLDPTALRALSGSTLVALAHPQRDAAAEMLGDSPPVIAERILELVRERVSA